MIRALRAAEFAEVYVIRREVHFPGAPTPSTVRTAGCRYGLIPNSPAWRDLEQSLAQADIRFTPSTTRVEARVGLVLSDAHGTALEIYSGDLPRPDGRVTALMQRQLVEVSASFAQALHSFAEAHPDLADIDQAMPERCGRPRPPETPLIPPPFHFSDPNLDRSHESLNDRVRAATMSLLRSNDAAHTAVREARDSPPDSPAWLRARSAVQQAVADVRSARQSLQVYGRFLDSAIGRVPEQEARLAVANRQMISDQLRAESDSLVTLLALLARLQIGWPP